LLGVYDQLGQGFGSVFDLSVHPSNAQACQAGD